MDNTNELLDHRIRERAFQLWQEAGCPDGRAEEFWHRARETESSIKESSQADDLAEVAGGHYPPTGDTQNFA